MDSAFLADLRRWGPDAPPRPVSPAAARAYCRRLATRHYENFLVASALLPRPLLPHFHAVYAWCRWADDLADETSGGAEALRLLEWWRGLLLAAFAGPATHPVLVALCPTIQRFAIPRDPFLNLLAAFEQDQRVKRYDTFAQLRGYCENSANPVGHLVLHLMEEFTPEKAHLADSICTGLQLANFWQDVARDADIGRRYLPQEDLDRFGYPEADWAARSPTPAFIELMRFQVERARTLLEAGRPLLPLLKEQHRPQIELFRQGGLAILDAIAAQSFDTWTKRPKVSKAKQLTLLATTATEHLLSPNPQSEIRNPQSNNGSPPPPQPSKEHGVRGSYRRCNLLARRQAKNFYFAFLLLPAEQRRAMTALYAFMRVADDLADEPGPLEAKRAALANWRRQLDEALAGRPAHPLLPALAHTVRRFRIDPAWLHDLLDGVAADIEPQRRFDQIADLERYCYQVAGTVGLCCVRVWGCGAKEAEPLALAGGRAFQLTNILRDQREDLAQGRCYLPLSWLKEAGLDETALRQEPNGPAAKAVYRRLGDLAEENYRAAAGLPQRLPPAGRAVWQVMSETYRRILARLRARDYDVTLPRARLSWFEKGRLFAAGLPTRVGWASK